MSVEFFSDLRPVSEQVENKNRVFVYDKSFVQSLKRIRKPL